MPKFQFNDKSGLEIDLTLYDGAVLSGRTIKLFDIFSEYTVLTFESPKAAEKEFERYCKSMEYRL